VLNCDVACISAFCLDLLALAFPNFQRAIDDLCSHDSIYFTPFIENGSKYTGAVTQSVPMLLRKTFYLLVVVKLKPPRAIRPDD